MPHLPSQQLETRQSVYVDAYDLAHLIESALAIVLAPPAAGLYLPNQLDPVLKVGGNYCYEKPVFLETVQDATVTTNRDLAGAPTIYDSRPLLNVRTTPWQYYHYEYIPVINLEEVPMTPWDVVHGRSMYENQPPSVVLPRHLAPLTSTTPPLPVVGLKIAQEIVRNEIDGSRAFNQKTVRPLEDIVIPFFRAEYQGVKHEYDRYGAVIATTHHMQSDRWLQDTLSLVYDAMRHVIDPIRTQLRNNPYQMCSVHHHDGYQLRVEQLGDWRIMEWEQLQADPEFQRWKQLRSNGTWDRVVSEQEEIIANHSAYIATSNPYR